MAVTDTSYAAARAGTDPAGPAGRTMQPDQTFDSKYTGAYGAYLPERIKHISRNQSELH